MKKQQELITIISSHISELQSINKDLEILKEISTAKNLSIILSPRGGLNLIKGKKQVLLHQYRGSATKQENDLSNILAELPNKNGIVVLEDQSVLDLRKLAIDKAKELLLKTCMSKFMKDHRETYEHLKNQTVEISIDNKNQHSILANEAEGFKTEGVNGKGVIKLYFPNPNIEVEYK